MALVDTILLQIKTMVSGNRDLADLNRGISSLSGNLLGLNAGLNLIQQVTQAVNATITSFKGWADAANQANTATQVFETTVRRFAVSTDEANGVVERLAARFGTTAQAIQGEMTTLMRVGFTNMAQLETVMTGAAASAIAAGRTAQEGFSAIADAAATGLSTRLNTIGIAQNLSTYNDKLAKSLNTQSDALNANQKALAVYNLILDATGTEVESLDLIQNEYVKSLQQVELSQQAITRTLGEMVMPIVAKFAQGSAQLTTALGAMFDAVRNGEDPLDALVVKLPHLASAVATLRPVLEGLRDYLDSAGEASRETFDRVISPALTRLAPHAQAMLAVVGPVLQRLWGVLEGLGGTVRQAFERVIMPLFEALAPLVMRVVQRVLPLLAGAGEAIQEYFGMVVAAWEHLALPVIKAIAPVVERAVDAVADALGPLLVTVKNIFKAVRQMLEGDWKGAWGTLVDAVGNALRGVQDLLDGLVDVIVTLLRNVYNLFDSKGKEIEARIQKFGSDLATKFIAGFNGIKAGIQDSIADALENALSRIPQPVLDGLKRIGIDLAGVVSGYRATANQTAADARTQQNLVQNNNIRGFTQDRAKSIAAAANILGINPNDLAAVISFETSGTFSPNARNPNSSGTGLIQFMQYTDGSDHGKNRAKWDYFGMTRDQFGGLSFEKQMEYVIQYLKGRGIGQGSTLPQIYQAIAGSGYKKGSDAYNLNRSWDSNGDGVITSGEQTLSPQFQAHVRNYFGQRSTPTAQPTVDMGGAGSATTSTTSAANELIKVLNKAKAAFDGVKVGSQGYAGALKVYGAALDSVAEKATKALKAPGLSREYKEAYQGILLSITELRQALKSSSDPVDLLNKRLEQTRTTLNLATKGTAEYTQAQQGYRKTLTELISAAERQAKTLAVDDPKRKQLGDLVKSSRDELGALNAAVQKGSDAAQYLREKQGEVLEGARLTAEGTVKATQAAYDSAMRAAGQNADQQLNVVQKQGAALLAAQQDYAGKAYALAVQKADVALKTAREEAEKLKATDAKAAQARLELAGQAHRNAVNQAKQTLDEARRSAKAEQNARLEGARQGVANNSAALAQLTRAGNIALLAEEARAAQVRATEQERSLAQQLNLAEGDAERRLELEAELGAKLLDLRLDVARKNRDLARAQADKDYADAMERAREKSGALRKAEEQQAADQRTRAYRAAQDTFEASSRAVKDSSANALRKAQDDALKAAQRHAEEVAKVEQANYQAFITYVEHNIQAFNEQELLTLYSEAQATRDGKVMGMVFTEWERRRREEEEGLRRLNDDYVTRLTKEALDAARALSEMGDTGPAIETLSETLAELYRAAEEDGADAAAQIAQIVDELNNLGTQGEFNDFMATLSGTIDEQISAVLTAIDTASPAMQKRLTKLLTELRGQLPASVDAVAGGFIPGWNGEGFKTPSNAPENADIDTITRARDLRNELDAATDPAGVQANINEITDLLASESGKKLTQATRDGLEEAVRNGQAYLAALSDATFKGVTDGLRRVGEAQPDTPDAVPADLEGKIAVLEARQVSLGERSQAGEDVVDEINQVTGALNDLYAARDRLNQQPQPQVKLEGPPASEFQQWSDNIFNLGREGLSDPVQLAALLEGLEGARKAGTLTIKELAFLKALIDDLNKDPLVLTSPELERDGARLEQWNATLTDLDDRFNSGQITAAEYNAEVRKLVPQLQNLARAARAAGKDDLADIYDKTAAALLSTGDAATKAIMALGGMGEMLGYVRDVTDALAGFAGAMGEGEQEYDRFTGTKLQTPWKDLQANLNGAANAAGKLLSMVGDVARILANPADIGAWVGLATKLVSSIADAIAGFQKAKAQLAQLKADFADQNPLLNPDDYQNAFLRSRGFFADLFGGGPQVVNEIDKVGLKYAQTIAGGITNGIRGGFSAALAAGDFSLFVKTFQQSVTDALTQSMLDAFMDDPARRTGYAENIKAYTDALKSGDAARIKETAAALRDAYQADLNAAKSLYENLEKVTTDGRKNVVMGWSDAVRAGVNSILSGANNPLQAMYDSIRQKISDAVVNGFLVRKAMEKLQPFLDALDDQLSKGLDINGALANLSGFLPTLTADLQVQLGPIIAAFNAYLPALNQNTAAVNGNTAALKEAQFQTTTIVRYGDMGTGGRVRQRLGVL